MNITEIPTPRTDAFIVEHQGWGPTDWNWRCFARQLERENAAMREVMKLAQAALQDVSRRGREFEDGHCPHALSSYLQTVAERAITKLKPYLL